MYRTALAVVLVSISTGVAASCDKHSAPPVASSAEPAQPPATAAAPATESATPTLPKHMAAHFTKGAAMQTAVIHGDLAGLKTEAKWMAEHELTSVSEQWRPYMQAMQSAAQHAVDAKDMAGAAHATAEMGDACGACHKALGGPKLDVSTPPAEGSGAALHMLRHQWAADRMWEGLFGPSDAAWTKGADVLADAPLTQPALAGEKSIPPEVELLAQKVHGFGEKARKAQGADRAALYGDFLATCASCHGKLGVK